MQTMPDKKRIIKLKRNFFLMFWIQALLNLKLMNLVSTLFYIQRGLTLTQIFYTAVIFSLVNILFEIPSSYLADKFGRKKTIVLSALTMIVSIIVQMFAHDFPSFILSFIFLALSFALMSGTDEALVYDTNKELGDETKSLAKMGSLHSASRILKILSALLGAFIAKDLIASQFQILLGLDTLVAAGALFLAFALQEPHHSMDVEKIEKGTLHDAVTLLSKDWQLTKVIFNKTLLFIASFILWRFHQKFFTDLGISIITLGIAWSIFNLMTYLSMRWISKFLPHKHISYRINLLNMLTTLSLALITLAVFFSVAPFIIFILFFAVSFFEIIRNPLYSEVFNKRSFSHNRATTLSLTNFFKSILDIPILLLAGSLVNMNSLYVMLLALCLGLVSLLFFNTHSKILTPHSTRLS